MKQCRSVALSLSIFITMVTSSLSSSSFALLGGTFSYSEEILRKNATLKIASGAAFNSNNLSDSSEIYLGRFSTNGGQGDVVKIPVDLMGNLGSIAWSAANPIKYLAPNRRNILTYDKNNGVGIPFRYYQQLPSYIKADLSKSSLGIRDALGPWRLLFIRGDVSQEGKLFPKRFSVLGDFVHSTPIYVGASHSPWPDLVPFPTGPGKQFSYYKKVTKHRLPMVYVGANDGMLHGFNALNGTEIFGYIPSAIISSQQGKGLHYLTEPGYKPIHYVDNGPVAEDVYTGTPRDGTKKWRTVLVGTLGDGGEGVFALDISQPTSVRESNASNAVLWEFTRENHEDLGYTFSSPVIGRMNNGRWAAIFGNGYNNKGSGRAKLFIVYLDGSKNGKWIKGKDYEVLDASDKGSVAKPNGLSTPAAVDIDGNFTIDRVYAGDLFGNLWAFDLSSSDSKHWKSAYGFKKPKPLFKGKDFQPITVKPMVAKNSSVPDAPSNKPNLLVLFGTGQSITEMDKISGKDQTFYGIWDAGKEQLERDDLVEQTILPISTSNERVMTNKPVEYKKGKKEGWYIDFKGGEKIITPSPVRKDIVVFTTINSRKKNPSSPHSTGWIMAVKVENGGEPKGDKPIIDVNGDRKLDNKDKIQGHIVSGVKIMEGLPNGPRLRGDYVFVSTSDGGVISRKILYQPTLKGRLAWQELSDSPGVMSSRKIS